ncbi:MAG TPA: BamA/TamA family outer membrane protein [Gemmatimonadaceae bacterium]|nr:BamA/TamA family outer membrane protein [Gemmatimonadaceae bacterium]
MLLTTLFALQVSVITDRPASRIPVTPEHLATAFRDSHARELFTRARNARVQQDSSLLSYDATVRERMAAGIAVGEHGRERALYSMEAAARVRWQRGIGAYVDLSGARVGIPFTSAQGQRGEHADMIANGGYSTVPYFPGQESLWLGGVVGNNQINDRQVVNPLADGAEAYYTYETGDSVSYILGDGRVVQVRELKVRPRTPSWNLAVGSLQFDVATGQVVAAMYRLAAPQDVIESVEDAIPDTAKGARRAVKIVKAFVPDVESKFSEIVIEYALHEGRFWLPRVRYTKGDITVGSIRLPARFEQAFRYDRVNAVPPLAPIVVDTSPRGRVRAPDSLRGEAATKYRDSVIAVRNAGWTARMDSVTKSPCNADGRRNLAHYRAAAKLKVSVSFPCDIDKLTTSPDLPKSIYADDDSTFTLGQLEDLAAQSLGMGAQAAFSLFRPQSGNWKYGLTMSRFNRVEGFSTAVRYDHQFGAGFVGKATARIGTGDEKGYGELSLARTNVATTVTLGAYHRLSAANDWGNPFSFGASMRGLWFGRDEGFYYRATGFELTTERGTTLRRTLRMFAEEQRNAPRATNFSIGGRFVANMMSSNVRLAGASLRLVHDLGRDPDGFRMSTDLRAEGAGGDSTYARVSLETTLSRSLGRNFAGALTLAGGTTAGGVPPQRRFYIGGTQSVRGQRADTAYNGNAFWLARAELGKDLHVARPSVFADFGWAGSRATKLTEIGRPMSGVGVGMSFLDGIVRIDLSRGLHPKENFHLDLSLGARW